MHFPILYQLNANGKTKIWEISTHNNQIITSFSIQNGKKNTTIRTITSGKNIGKRNETTPEQQAIHEAQSKWNAKRDQGYVSTKPKHTTNSVSSKKVILPMLALDYHKQKDKIEFPCYVQPKLDGVRGIGHNGSIYSRNGKPFDLLHITNELSNDIILDGELYIPFHNFQQLISILKNSEMKKTDIKYYVFDIISDDGFEQRLNTMAHFIQNKFNIVIVPTFKCENENEIDRFYHQFIQEGYEGLIIRNIIGSYEQNKRSKNLQKYKLFKDEEFIIVDYAQGTGIEEGCVVWICETKTHDRFSVRPRGTHSERKQLYKNATNYIGLSLTVRYQNLSENGIPRFPVGISIRDYE